MKIQGEKKNTSLPERMGILMPQGIHWLLVPKGMIKREKYQHKMEVMMKKRKKYFKVVYLVFICAFSFSGCSNNRNTEEEKIFVYRWRLIRVC